MIDEKEILHIIKDIEDLQEAVNYVMNFDDENKREFVEYIKQTPPLMSNTKLMTPIFRLFYETDVFDYEYIKSFIAVAFEEAKRKMSDDGYINLREKNIFDVLKKIFDAADTMEALFSILSVCRSVLNLNIDKEEGFNFYFDGFIQDFSSVVNKFADILDDNDKEIIKRWYRENNRKKGYEFYENFPVMILTKDEIENVLFKIEGGMNIFIKKGAESFSKEFLDVYQEIFLKHREKIRSLLVRSILLKIVVLNSSKDFVCSNMKIIKKELKYCSKDSETFYEKLMFWIRKLKTDILIFLGKLPIFRWFINVQVVVIEFMGQGLEGVVNLVDDLGKQNNIEKVREKLKEMDCNKR